MSELSEVDEPLFSGRQAAWILVAVGWVGISLFQFVDGRPLFGAAGLLVAAGGVYRVARPG